MIRTGVFILWLIFSIFFKIRSGISFSIAIAFLFGSFIATLTSHQGFALRLFVYSFLFLFVGLVGYLRELWNEKK